MSKIVKEGFEIGGVILGQKCIYEGKEETIIGYDKDSNILAVAITCSHSGKYKSIQESEHVHVCLEKYVHVYLEKYKDCKFEWVSIREIQLIPYKQPQQKEPVLELEFKEAFDDEWLVRIKYQNTDVLKRGEFNDYELDVISAASPMFGDNQYLYIRGIDYSTDKSVSRVSNEKKIALEEKVRLINEKYGIPIDTEESILAEIEEAGTKEKIDWNNKEQNKVYFYKLYNHNSNRYEWDYTSSIFCQRVGEAYYILSVNDILSFIERLDEVANNK